MAQLTDDCFVPGAPVLRVEEAAALIAQRLPVTAGIETVPLGLADGRVAAADIHALHAVPPFANSAVDGYAVRHADLAPEGPTRLPVTGRLPAGAQAGEGAVWPGAVRIFTGAALPPGADTVFMQEDVTLDGDRVSLPPGLIRGANARAGGEDAGEGALVIPQGRRLRPQDLALAAASGHDRLPVRRRLRVAVFSTGDELTEPGRPLAPGAIHDSNRVMIAALLARLGAEVADLGILRDAPAALAARLSEAAAGHDLVLTSGGVSVGEEDHVRGAVEAVGRLAFWRLAIKPGRPVAMGIVAGTPFVGLPGNPVAAYVTLAFVVGPLLARLGGALYTAPEGQPVRAVFGLRKRPGRREFLRASLRTGLDGLPELHRFPRDGSALLSSLTESDGLAEIPDEATRIEPGAILRFHPYGLLW
ncbi:MULTISPECIES: gephyrin-like molybdotransferase Glp [Methylobacterium]|uniref:Molybdopterin molybdenumtransferase n=2 Tax=Pseudomonadota TaxID=1224 RepID=A0ABQ4SY50_9HYPH|nr:MULTISPECIES: gephyrin-like molybdotransferase Glp [Methylobacterium]PIU08507.1 MAG: molybdopterin molybdenumtransferase MoeA [Methylobacterium sp. CG09_land_8_20_14_0_10_71_15]PIU15146.1 MAG: molybdopterin molybdenumtransferase MoeA [Methylobacterium sp. CG08_land_8_20_14_0_20_71_15]GBU19187.1 molybdopterin molybdenumtransferase [Methylobacterium sp.]GJE08145.1 Molybdopterin molybdenumtransferase [Methylobacterium jeotgali]